MPNDHDRDSSLMPDPFDRALGRLDGAQAVTSTRAALARIIPPLGVGGALGYTVQTYREEGDLLPAENGKPERRAPAVFTCFLEVAHGNLLKRIVVPDEVLSIMQRQRDSLTSQALRRSARQGAATRKAAGFKPTPPRRKKGKGPRG